MFHWPTFLGEREEGDGAADPGLGLGGLMVRAETKIEDSMLVGFK